MTAPQPSSRCFVAAGSWSAASATPSRSCAAAMQATAPPQQQRRSCSRIQRPAAAAPRQQPPQATTRQAKGNSVRKCCQRCTAQRARMSGAASKAPAASSRRPQVCAVPRLDASNAWTARGMRGKPVVFASADGRPRLQGELMLSRAFGDLPYREVGLTAEPEFSAWHTVSPGGVMCALRPRLCMSSDPWRLPPFV